MVGLQNNQMKNKFSESLLSLITPAAAVKLVASCIVGAFVIGGGWVKLQENQQTLSKLTDTVSTVSAKVDSMNLTLTTNTVVVNTMVERIKRMEDNQDLRNRGYGSAIGSNTIAFRKRE